MSETWRDLSERAAELLESRSRPAYGAARNSGREAIDWLQALHAWQRDYRAAKWSSERHDESAEDQRSHFDPAQRPAASVVLNSRDILGVLEFARGVMDNLEQMAIDAGDEILYINRPGDGRGVRYVFNKGGVKVGPANAANYIRKLQEQRRKRERVREEFDHEDGPDGD